MIVPPQKEVLKCPYRPTCSTWQARWATWEAGGDQGAVCGGGQVEGLRVGLQYPL